MNSQNEERLFIEQQKIREVVSQPITEQELAYYNNHHLLQESDYPQYMMEYYKNHPILQGVNDKFGKIVMDI